ncbi:MAG: response regulator [Candidatus Methylacidiphilales bacterium]|nr:response regulator [Candidatus Methylacidiphilales bacterium]
MPAILILEDSQVLLTKLTHELKAAFPECQVLGARSVAEAHTLFSDTPIDVFILDIFLPDGNGIDFLCDVKTISPDSAAVIMTAQQVPDLRQHAEELGVVRFFQKPVDVAALQKIIHRVFHPEDEPAAPAPDPQSFVASLGGLTTIDIIQLKCLARATQVLRFVRADGQSGKIHFQRGEIIHAEAPDRKGLPAFNEIVSWKGGRVEESAEPLAEPTIQQGWEGLLMDAVRVIDENAALKGS